MIPRATYRLQFHKNFPFEAALPLAPYLRQLGISHVYSSPILKARAGSMHGYDVVDHSRINPELGGEKEFRQLAETLRSNGLGIVLDIVPNHMAVDSENGWWMDMLQHGRASRFADYFDIDWDMLGGKILAAFLGKPYWQTLEAGEISVAPHGDEGKPSLRYFDRVLPLRTEDHGIDPGAFSTPDQLHELLERQHYRLAWWRTANDTINWRRFFDVADLIALKQEADGVFEATHAKIFELYREGLIDGLRIDHVDGLKDPTGYCQRLRSRLDELRRLRSSPDPHPYVVVEKILAPRETLPPDWPVDGTTGYDFMNQISALQHSPAGSEPLKVLWHRISGRQAEFEPEEELARAQIVTASFESALTRTAEVFGILPQNAKSGRDITAPAIRRGLVHILQQLRIYRTYTTDEPDSPSPGLLFDRAVRKAEQRASGIDKPAIDFIAEVMRGRINETGEAVRRFNQLSAPVAAKAVEDTAFYRYGRLLSRNDVGFDPGGLSITAADFHAAFGQRAATFPHSMLATATHDHKRGEDVRARLAVLSEIPEEWTKAVEGWFRLNAAQKPALVVEPRDEYQLYQTLVGIWPLNLRPDDNAGISALCERVVAWQEKALREAKLRTSWLDPDEEFECANREFARVILDTGRSSEFLESMSRFVERIAPAGALNGLVQVALRCTAPGVPDCYQGTEFWDLSLVDPDNRRAVEFATRIGALEQKTPPASLLPQWRDGRVKQALLSTLLCLRSRRLTLFESGSYQPLQARGSRSANVLAFARTKGKEAIVVALPLRCAGACAGGQPLPAAEFWEDTEIVLPQSLHGGGWQSLFGGEDRFGNVARCADVFAKFPAAIFL
ncbi:MAG TPA: malto-oligosyltrehalose synthase [Rhizomicrobium sp.]|jgi:(1->4)-alpha-D-glucan 1-alpha-D-glucosylmutase|nr:malto-oligosyltrehalose synthase [Rhizomicrobium sp.]